MFKFGTTSRVRLSGVNPELIEIANLAIKLSKIDFGIPQYGGIRTAEDQAKLYADGKSKADGVTNLSNHQSGDALDFYAYIDGGASWRHDHLAMVATAFLQAASMLGYKLNWGGLWSSSKKTNGIPYGWDCAHIELG